MEDNTVPECVVFPSQRTDENTKRHKPYKRKEIKMNGSKRKTRNHYNEALIKKCVEIIVKHSAKRKLFKNSGHKRNGVKHYKHGEVVDLVSFIQIDIGAKETYIDLRDKNIYNWWEDDRCNNYSKQRKPAKIIEAKNGFEWSEIYFGKINRNSGKKNFYPE